MKYGSHFKANIEFRSPVNRTLFVKGFPKRIKSSHLSEVFSCFGDVTRAEIPVNRRTGLPLEFGFVEFKNCGDAERAMECMNEVRGWLLVK